MFDFLIENGKIVDGTGNVGFCAAIGITGDRIRILRGDVAHVQAVRRIDAMHQLVVPGFIDVHTHSDLMALSEPTDSAKVAQGVCTEVLGLDGIGYAPLSNENLGMMLRHYAGLNGHPQLNYQWNSVAEFLECFRHKTSTNVAYLVPHGCLRSEVLGWADRPASADEIRRMEHLLQQGMADGAVGLSTGLSYAPGAYAGTEELIELCKTVARSGGVYVTHVRYHLGDKRLDPFREAVKIGLRSGCPVHLSHFYPDIDLLQGHAAQMLDFVDSARARGLDITFDAYPYEAESTALHVAVPLWAHEGGPNRLLERLRERATRDRMERDAGNEDVLKRWVIAAVKTEKNRWCEGLSIEKIANALGKTPWHTVCDLLSEEDLRVAFWSISADMNDVKVMMTHPAHMFMTDGLRIGGHPNPRTYGAYPRILGQLVRDEKVLTLEQAIRKMTSFPAQRFALTDRGVLRDNVKADLAVVDPVTVAGVATFADPKQPPLGIDYVFVNGQVVVETGRHTGALSGEPLKSS